MEIKYNTGFEGLFVIVPDVYADIRGYFCETFNMKKYDSLNLDNFFLQDNISKSKKDTIRGLHFQRGESAQGKLCQVISGNVLDIAVDLRFNSPTFGKYFSIELSEENHLQVYIPIGFAHGFSVLSNEAIFNYKCTNYYNKENERTILYNDPDLNIDWKVEKPILSGKDLTGKLFKELHKDFFFDVTNFV